MLARNDLQVRRSLRVNVGKRDYALVLESDAGRDLLRGDFAEQTIHPILPNPV